MLFNKDLAYLAGIIIGDGHVSNSRKSKKDCSKDYKISIEIVDKKLLNHIVQLIKKIVNTKSTIKSRERQGKKKELLFSI